MEKIATVILAAGEASRMGQPKQLLPIGPQNLVQRALQTVQTAQCHRNVVVTGAYADLVQPTISKAAATCVYNPAWKEGMGSSIRTGVNAVLATYPDTEALIILLCDQPMVSPQLLRKLVVTHVITRHAMVVSEYSGVQGVPALFHHTLFPALLQLPGDTGARAFIQQYSGGVAAVPFSEGKYDIDTPEDYHRMKQLLGLAPQQKQNTKQGP